MYKRQLFDDLIYEQPVSSTDSDWKTDGDSNTGVGDHSVSPHVVLHQFDMVFRAEIGNVCFIVTKSLTRKIILSGPGHFNEGNLFQ